MKSLTPEIQDDTRCWPSTETLAPCQNACPIGMDVEGYIRAIRNGKFEESWAIIRRSNPLAAVCGRVCHRPCEDACLRSKIDEPVDIRSLKRFIADRELGSESEVAVSVKKTGDDMVAIVGSGPAGLTAGHFLAKEGYRVTIFEALPVCGGMLRVGIPEYRLPKKILESEIERIRRLGIGIKTNTLIGKDLTISDILSKGYKAVFIAVGAHKSQKLGVPGEGCKGVIHGVSFLRDLNSGKEVRVEERIAVVGGGNTAIDVARSALRSGAGQVSIVYRRSREEMLASDEEVSAALNEGVNIHYLAAPIEFLSVEDKVIGLRCVEMELGEPDTSGRRKPIPIKDSEFVLQVDMVIPAIGELPDLSYLATDLETTHAGTVAVDPDTLATSIPGVFAGGTAVAIQSKVIDAIADGRKAAIAIDRYLRGSDVKTQIGIPPSEALVEISDTKIPRFLKHRERQIMPTLSHELRTHSYEEVEKGFSDSAAVDEAGRCLSCSVCGNCIYDRSQMCYETARRLL